MFVGRSVLEVLRRLTSVYKNICRAETHSADIENQKLLKTKNRSQQYLKRTHSNVLHSYMHQQTQ